MIAPFVLDGPINRHAFETIGAAAMQVALADLQEPQALGERRCAQRELDTGPRLAVCRFPNRECRGYGRPAASCPTPRAETAGATFGGVAPDAPFQERRKRNARVPDILRPQPSTR